jgi:poly(3-hydroxybutyrate) depolymerase
MGGEGGGGGGKRDSGRGESGSGGASSAGGAGGLDAALASDFAAAPTAPDASTPDTRPVDSGAADVPGPSLPATASEGCMKPHPTPAEGFRDLVVAGETRRFILRVPSTYDGKKPWPVIFVFHGAGQSASYFDGNTDLRAVTEEKAVLVFPDGPVKPDGRRSWVFRSPDNVVFVDALVGWLKANLCIDPSRLFATGLSSGGYMSLTLACQRGDVFRAVASASGGMVETSDCRGNPHVWLRLGKADSAGTIDSLEKARDFWVAHKGCQRDNPAPVDPPPCVGYAGCRDGARVVLCADGGGHGWPAYYSKAIWGEFSRP